MAKSQVSFNKKEKEKKRLKKRKDKEAKREERKQSEKSSNFEDMIAYVDENGNITDTPPDPSKKKEIKAKNIEIGVPKREKEENPVLRGRLEYFNDSKGFGFIRQIDSQNRYFVHINGMLEELHENDIVVFELERGLKGMNAVRVKKG